MAWSLEREPLAVGTTRYVPARDGQPASFAQIAQAWQREPAWRELFVGALHACPYRAYRFETPPVSRATRELPFQFVLVEDRSLSRRPEPAAFAEHFVRDQGVVSFPNLGADAVLVVPAPDPECDPAVYAHLATFVRGAPAPQVHLLWAAVGQQLEAWWERAPAPFWTSTAGGGVAWLHVRLDQRPKYYWHRPYRDPQK
jgi:hypothetical protein